MGKECTTKLEQFQRLNYSFFTNLAKSDGAVTQASYVTVQEFDRRRETVSDGEFVQGCNLKVVDIQYTLN